MSKLTKIIKERRSVRKFSSLLPSKALIDEILEAGIYAASGRGKQAPIVIAITNKELRDTIAEENRKIGGWEEGFDPFYGAPIIVLVIAPKEIPTAVYDGSLSIGNMMLKAQELGLGSCWIHRAKEEMESELGKDILDKIGLNGEYIGIGHLALGIPDVPPEPIPERLPDRIFYID